MMSVPVAMLLAGGLLYLGFVLGYMRRGTVERERPRAERPRAVTLRDATLIAYWRKLAELRGKP